MALSDTRIPKLAEPEDDPLPPADEIIDLTDRRRVLLQAVLGVDVEPGFADAVFDPARSG